jgi:hypothetical protein
MPMPCLWLEPCDSMQVGRRRTTAHRRGAGIVDDHQSRARSRPPRHPMNCVLREPKWTRESVGWRRAKPCEQWNPGGMSKKAAVQSWMCLKGNSI